MTRWYGATLAALALATACATTPPGVEAQQDQAAEQVSTPVEETVGFGAETAVVYENLDKSVEQMTFLSKNMWPSPDGEAPEVEIIAAHTARSLIEANWYEGTLDPETDDPAWQFINSLLAHPDAKALLIETHAGLSGPEQVVVLLAPKEPVAPFDNGFLFELGVESVRRGNLLAETDVSALQTELDESLTAPGFEELSVEEVAAKVGAGETFLLFVGAEGCGASRAASPHFRAYFESRAVEAPVFQTIAETNRRPIAEEILPWQWVSYPSMVVVKDGRVVDMTVGVGRGNYRTARLDNLLARNGLLDASVRLLTDYTDAPEDHTRRIRTLSAHGSFPDTDFRGADLSGVHWKSGKLDGSNFEGATLRDANLSYANLAHANLEGADLGGASVEGAFWSNTICPDGSNSDNHGFTCEGHLSLADAEESGG